MTTNSFTICGEEMQPIGVGIYLGSVLENCTCIEGGIKSNKVTLTPTVTVVFKSDN